MLLGVLSIRILEKPITLTIFFDLHAIYLGGQGDPQYTTYNGNESSLYCYNLTAHRKLKHIRRNFLLTRKKLDVDGVE